MADNQIPVVGEPFKGYVDDQITVRQKIHGSGFSNNRNPNEIIYLNSRTSWIKMASSVEVLESKEGKKRLQKLGLTNFATGTDLAKKAVLFNSLGENNEKTTSSNRAGVATNNSLINNSAYGFGGTEFGLQPLPGIIDFSISHTNRGSIRTGEIKLKAYNKFQFELIEILYLRLGYTMMVEWGDSVYFNNDNKFTISTTSLIDEYWFTTQGDSQLTVLDKIENKRKQTNGNFDALFAKVVNFDWTFTPQGTYEISIKFASLGDVVESFKINAIPPKLQVNETTTKTNSGESLSDEQLNLNILSRYFQNIKLGPPQETFNVSDSKHPFYQAFCYIGADEVDSSTRTNENKGVKLKDRYYIRFQHLLDFLWRETIVFFKSKSGECYPIFDIDLSDQSLMRSFEYLISINPNICVVNNKNAYQIALGDNPPSWTNNLAPFLKDNNGTSAIIANIYLNMDMVESIFKTNIDSKGNLSYYNFITAILNKLNASFGYICDLELTIDDDKCMAIIRDQKYYVKHDSKGKRIDTNSKPIEVYGYNDKKSNFVKNYSFTTQINNELADMLTIGATAANTIVNVDSTLFEKWNQGLQDRFKTEGTNSKPDACKIPKSYNNVLTGTPPDLSFSWMDYILFLIKESSKTEISALGKGIRELVKFFSNSEVAAETKKLAEEEYKSWIKYLQFAFSPSVNTITNKNSVIGGYYFLGLDSFIQRGKVALENFIKTEYKKIFDEKKIPSSNIGFIPLELNLEVDGISGIKIYNQLIINTDFLPYNYPNVMEFVIMGVDHKLENNKWTTNIRAISKPKSLPISSFGVQGPLNEQFSQVGESDFGTISNTQ